MQRLDTTTTIDTPERVRFAFRLAGPGLRAAAWLIDVFLQVLVLIALGVGLAVVSVAGGELASGLSLGLFLIALFAITWLYGAGFEWAFSGQTPGKRVIGLRVVREDGAPIGAREALLRNLARGADALPFAYTVGALVAVIDPRSRRLGDLLAGTMVVVEQRTGLLTSVAIDPPLSDDERAALPVRVTLLPAERRAIETLLRRRARLSTARVTELAGLLAPVLRAREGVVADDDLRVLTLAYARAAGREDG